MKALSYLSVGLGAFVGANSRYLMEKFLEQFIPNNAAILIINVLGCFCIGLLSGWLIYHVLHPHLSTFLITGFCGGFTTFSSMVYYLVKPWCQGDFFTVLLYCGLNAILGVLAAYLGIVFFIKEKELWCKI